MEVGVMELCGSWKSGVCATAPEERKGVRRGVGRLLALVEG